MTKLDFFVLSVSLFAVSQSHIFLSSLLTVVWLKETGDYYQQKACLCHLQIDRRLTLKKSLGYHLYIYQKK